MSKEIIKLPYPSINGANFYELLFNKDEFYKNRTVIDENMEMEDVCDDSKKTLFPHQIFVRNYMKIWNDLIIMKGKKKEDNLHHRYTIVHHSCRRFSHCVNR